MSDGDDIDHTNRNAGSPDVNWHSLDDALGIGSLNQRMDRPRAPLLEEELALAGISRSILIGQARGALYQAAGELTGHSEDELAYLRDPPSFRNALIMELPNGDFAFTIARLFFVSVASDQRWRGHFDDPALSAVAEKAMKETAYHVRHTAEWLIRLGDGTEESHHRAQSAVDALWPYTGEMTGAQLPPGFRRSRQCWSVRH